MSVKEWFGPLHQQLRTIEREWPEADESRQLKLAESLLALRQISDQVADEWLAFEERLSRVIKAIKGGQLTAGAEPIEATAEEVETATSEKPGKEADDGQQDDPVETYRLLYRKGEGFYHLRMFEDAKIHFADLVKSSPDWESGRLYYAYSLFFCGESEAALREFRLLSRSADSPEIAAISFNAIGCLLAEEGQWLEAIQAFTAALEADGTRLEAQYNLALCYLQEGEPKEAMATIATYLDKAESDWEAQILWLRAARQLDGRELPEPPGNLQLPSRQLDSQTLREMAALSEADGKIHRAQLCYRYLCERLPKEGWVWHGLAWNVWLISGFRQAVPLLKKAISLAPDNLDFLFSFGWMHLFAGEREKALAVFRFILLRDRDHRLAQSGLVTLYAQAGDFLEAKRIAQTFTGDADPYVQSLGYYQLGQIAVREGNWKLADQYFRMVNQTDGQFREVPLYLALCDEKMGKPHTEEKRVLPL